MDFGCRKSSTTSVGEIIFPPLVGFFPPALHWRRESSTVEIGWAFFVFSAASQIFFCTSLIFGIRSCCILLCLDLFFCDPHVLWSNFAKTRQLHVRVFHDIRNVNNKQNKARTVTSHFSATKLWGDAFEYKRKDREENGWDAWYSQLAIQSGSR